MTTANQNSFLKWIAGEPFRVFFPTASLAAVWGVALWPLSFAGIVPFYAGVAHARLMAHGFLGGFILGFLGTALPRMLSAPRLKPLELMGLYGVYLAMVIAHGAGKTFVGDVLFLVLSLGFVGAVGILRFIKGNDLPPPGFVLAGLALACAMAGAILALLPRDEETSFFRIALQPLLFYQGFILLPVLGVGSFLLPRFFQLPNQHDFPESRTPSPEWLRKAGIAFGVGGLIIASFLIEAAGYKRMGACLRLLIAAAYLFHELPIHRSSIRKNALATSIRIALFSILAGILLIVFIPAYRVALLHLTLVGGMGVLTITVATRVVFGHSGNQPLLQQRNRWLIVSVILMLTGMATRISGDFWPKIQVSHYEYGAGLWLTGMLIWAWHVLPKVAIRDPKE